MAIDRVRGLSEADFIKNYLNPGVPVVVKDAMENWNIAQFHPQAISNSFGDEFVQVYDDLFALQNVQTLNEYLAENFSRPASEPRCQRYVRWYTQLKDVEFLWADHIFELLKPHWSKPYFLPNTQMIIPPVTASGTICPTESQFPYKGLFISGRGSRTRLHRDPWHSNAVLCQFYGEKLIKLYDRNQTDHVTDGEHFVDPLNPDLNKFPNFPRAALLDEFILAPGDVIFLPRGVFHDVTSVSDSVSITWNFVHAVNKPHFLAHIARYPQEKELGTARYFLKTRIPAEAGAEQIKQYVESHFSDLAPTEPAITA